MKQMYMKLYRPLAGLLVLLIFALLASCSSNVRKDGPPNFYVDASKVPDAVPKPEKLAKYGNMRSYVVNGKRYYTMRTSRHYDVIGTASWYGTRFDTHRTSSGERYNLLGMTAAHKTLPLPTYVEVTNLKNQRKVIVKVNDRGPFKTDRIIDLSYVAAKKLGMLGHGTATVRVKAIDPDEFGRNIEFAKNTRSAFRPLLASPSFAQNQSRPAFKPLHNFAQDKPRPLFRPHPIYSQHTKSSHSNSDAIANTFVYLQVGAFKNLAYAQKFQSHLVSLVSEPVNIIHPTNSSRLYRVKIGPLKNVTAVNKLTTRLKNLGIKSNKLDG